MHTLRVAFKRQVLPHQEDVRKGLSLYLTQEALITGEQGLVLRQPRVRDYLLLSNSVRARRHIPEASI